jgi:hypothetical protein
MQYEHGYWSQVTGYCVMGEERLHQKAQLVLYLGSRDELEKGLFLRALKTQYPDANIVGCSIAEERDNDQEKRRTDIVMVIALSFAATRIRLISVYVKDRQASYQAGTRIAAFLKAPELSGVFVLTDGLNVSDDALIRGMRVDLAHVVPIVGQLTAQDTCFPGRLVGCNFIPAEKKIVAIGFYGKEFIIEEGCFKGWTLLEKQLQQQKGLVF